MFDKWRSAPTLPGRISASLEDDLEQQKHEAAMQAIGQFEIFGSWSDQLSRRPFDKPMYTALAGIPTILVYFSTQAVASRELFERIFTEQRPWAFWVMAIADGPFPVLRTVLVAPDDPRRPYAMESPLDVRQGDVQAFCEAAFDQEYVDLMATHTEMPEGTHAASSYHAPGLSAAMRREVRRVAARVPGDATREDFQTGVQAMEARYASPFDGLEPNARISLTFAGEARNPIIKVSF
jgi:hypothetical protein